MWSIEEDENVDATMKTVQGLLNANFIFEVRYTQRLSNFILVKKVSWEWRMYVDYINLNRECPKDSYLLQNINKLVDSLVG